ncbi:MAG: thiol peroxidase [Pseudomonadota bacterium]|nr:thiol peroxidase [Pseudomonadota bacterium]
MTRLTLNGIATYTEGTLPRPGQEAPKFLLTTSAFEDVGLDHFPGRCKVLNIVPSIELPSCRLSSRRLEEGLRDMPSVALLTISRDLPFIADSGRDDGARSRGVTLSTFRCPSFARSYGVDIVSGPLRGLMARAVLVIDARNRVLHAELVRELSEDPDCLAALSAARLAVEFGSATAVSSADETAVAV